MTESLQTGLRVDPPTTPTVQTSARICPAKSIQPASQAQPSRPPSAYLHPLSFPIFSLNAPLLSFFFLILSLCQPLIRYWVDYLFGLLTAAVFLKRFHFYLPCDLSLRLATFFFLPNPPVSNSIPAAASRLTALGRRRPDSQ